jgi:N-acetylglucosamine-6-phosphate deacetylase
VLTLDRALENFLMFTRAALEDALPLLTANPAAMTGFADRAGSIAVGQKADFVAVDAKTRLVASIIGGRPVG